MTRRPMAPWASGPECRCDELERRIAELERSMDCLPRFCRIHGRALERIGTALVECSECARVRRP